MRLLLDTHTIFWWLEEKGRLSSIALAAISSQQSDVFVSIASAWEMAIKVGSGKWPEAAGLIQNFEREMAAERFRVVTLTLPHVGTAGPCRPPIAIRSTASWRHKRPSRS